LAGEVGEAAGAVLDGIAVKVGIDVAVARVTGVDSRVLIAVGVNVKVAVAEGRLIGVGVDVEDVDGVCVAFAAAPVDRVA
jgi:hypothetical protein